MELQGRKCGGCGRRFIGNGACPSCGRRDGLEAELFSGKGTLHSFSRVHVPTPGHQARAPYVLALIDLAEGVRVTGQIETESPDKLDVGSSVGFAHETDGVFYFQG